LVEPQRVLILCAVLVSYVGVELRG
jgi:hypothetical protein